MASLTLGQNRQLSLALPALDGLGLLTGALYQVFFGLGFASFTDPDYWWHLRTGRLIVEDLSIPRHDPYSFLIAGHSWLLHEWLSEVLIYLGVSRLGYAITLGLFIAITLAAFGLMHRLLIRLGTPRPAALGLVALGVLTSLPYWTVRPQVLSWFLIAVTVNALWGRTKAPWLLVPLFALWANLHVGFLFGLGVIGLWYVSLVWERLAERADIDLRQCALFVAACVAASMLSPNGPSIFVLAAQFTPVIGTSDLRGISEWQSPNFHAAMHLPLLAGILVLIGLAIAGRVRDRFALLLAVVFAALALQSSRYQPLFALAFLPAAGLASIDLIAHRPRMPAMPHTALNWALVAATALAVLVAIPSLPSAQVHRQAITNGRVYYPAEGLAWVQEHRPDANVLAQYEWGGYFIWGLYPQGHVYIDGRTEIYGGRLLDRYRDIVAARDGWQQSLDASGADTVVIDGMLPLASALRQDASWSLALEGPREVVFIRR